MWIEPVLNPRSGKASFNGFQPAEFPVTNYVVIEGTSRPDFIFCRVTPKQASRNAGKSFLVGDIKLSGHILYTTYVANKKTNQLDASLSYAKKYTSSNAAFFLKVFPGQQDNYDKAKKLVMSRGFSKGVIFVVFSVGK